MTHYSADFEEILPSETLTAKLYWPFCTLTVKEKYQIVAQAGFGDCQAGCQYRAAMQDGDMAKIDEIESHGVDLPHAIFNYDLYSKAALFGWQLTECDPAGWLRYPQFENLESWFFGPFFEKRGRNALGVGSAPNGVWTYRAAACSEKFTIKFGGDLDGDFFPSKKEAVLDGLNFILGKLSIIPQAERSFKTKWAIRDLASMKKRISGG